MSRFIGFLLCAGAAAAAVFGQNPVGRIYFDRAGNGGSEGPYPDGGHPGQTAKENPTLVGGGRLYLYWEFSAWDQKMLLRDFNVEVDGGTIREAFFYNNPNVGNPPLFGARWNVASPRPPVRDPGSSVQFRAGSIDKFAVKNDAVARQFDHQLSQFDGPFGSTILGYVDVSSPDRATVWMSLNGFNERPIHLGFGDPPVFFGRSELPDAVIIPEPAGAMLLLVLGGLALRRRG